MGAEHEQTSTVPSTGVESMFEFLQGVLHKLEAAQGCIDDEARQGLELLRKKTKELEDAQARRTSTSDMPLVPPTHEHITNKIEQLQGDLSELEDKLDNMDAVAKQLVSHSTSLWLSESGEPVAPTSTQAATNA